VKKNNGLKLKYLDSLSNWDESRHILCSIRKARKKHQIRQKNLRKSASKVQVIIPWNYIGIWSKFILKLHKINNLSKWVAGLLPTLRKINTIITGGQKFYSRSNYTLTM
jgi:hypothetical protein